MTRVVPVDEQIACVERELGFRRKLYPRWVAASKLTQEAADQELERMGAVLLSLQRVRRQQDALVAGAAEIRAGARARVICHLTPMLPSKMMMQLLTRLRELDP